MSEPLWRYAGPLPVCVICLLATGSWSCKVYLPMCQPSEDAPVGVTVHRVVEDEDGGAP